MQNPTSSVDRMVCALVLSRQDLSKATRPIEKLGSNEYFRALNNHRALRKTTGKSDNTSDPEYTIDKVVRQRLKQGSFGYDNSSLVSLELRLREQYNSKTLEELFKSDHNQDDTVSKMLLDQLESSELPKHKLTHEEWLRSKDAEIRLKKQLMITIYEYKLEQELLERQDKETRKRESALKVSEWYKRKKLEKQQKNKGSLKTKSTLVSSKREKRRIGEEAYREWLRGSLLKMRKQKRHQKNQKKLEKDQEEQHWLDNEFKRNLTEQKFTEWLEVHKHVKTHCKEETKTTHKYRPHRRVYGLAYSLNKKKDLVLPFVFEDRPRPASDNSMIIRETSYEHLQEEEDEIEVQQPHTQRTKEFRFEKNQIFEELSSIQRSEQFVGQLQSGDRQERSGGFSSEEDSGISNE